MCAAILKGKVPQGTECIYRESELEADARAESHWDHRAVQSLAIYTHTSANEAWDEVQWLMGNVASSPSLIIQDSIVNNNQIFDLMTCYIVRTRLICVSFFYLQDLVPFCAFKSLYKTKFLFFWEMYEEMYVWSHVWYMNKSESNSWICDRFTSVSVTHEPVHIRFTNESVSDSLMSPWLLMNKSISDSWPNPYLIHKQLWVWFINKSVSDSVKNLIHGHVWCAMILHIMLILI